MFTVGARVAYKASRYDKGYAEKRVAKVHKSGRFTLEGSPQQWRPYDCGDGKWRAHETGGNLSTSSVVLWNDAAAAEIEQGTAAQKRADSLARIREWIERLDSGTSWIDQAKLDQIEELLCVTI